MQIYDIYNDFYLFDPAFNSFRLVANNRERQEIGDQIDINRYYSLRRGWGGSANFALVGDNSYFGLTAPLAGHRFRFGAEYITGVDRYTSLIADFRKYQRFNKFTFAVRGLSYLRFEQTQNSVFPFYIGDMGFVRGYGSIFSNTLDNVAQDFGQLVGSKMLLSSAEIRLPFLAPQGLGIINSRTVFADLNLFFDAGVAFDEFSHLSDGELLFAPVVNQDGTFATDPSTGEILYSEQLLKPTIATSIGVSARINLFGALIIEPYYAWQLTQDGRASFGLNFIPGW